MKNFFNSTIYNNTVLEYLTYLGIILLAFLIIFVIKKTVVKNLKRSINEHSIRNDSLLLRMIERIIIPIIFLSALFLAENSLEFDTAVYKVFSTINTVIAAFFIIQLLVSITHYLLNIYSERSVRENDKPRVKALSSLFSFAVWVFGLLFLLDNLGFEISTLIAGLGISGIAVALAAQTILGDLFSYFVIFFDRPFEIGDFITVDDKMGTIEKIGIKSTKLRSMNGESLIVSNSNLTNSRVHNYKQMVRRRNVFTIGVTYDTGLEKLKEIPELITKIILKYEQTEVDRCHFKNYGAYSLDFETVYFVNNPDFKNLMNINQNILLNIYEEFEKRNIEFAFPTQTIHLDKKIN